MNHTDMNRAEEERWEEEGCEEEQTLVLRAPEINRKSRGREQLDWGRIFARSGRGRKGRIRAQATTERREEGFARRGMGRRELCARSGSESE